MDRRTFIGLLGAAGASFGLAGPAGLSAPTAHAASDPAPGRAPHQPYMHGYDAASIKNWSPRTDRHARFFRSRVPLGTRIAPFAATQANPALATGPLVMNLSYDYDNSFFTAYKCNDVFARRLLRFWQYTDLYGSWHGLPVDGSPTDAPDHGLINLPNPAYTDAAHRNGVKSLGCWFWPRSGAFSAYLEQRADGSFPVADKRRSWNTAARRLDGFEGRTIAAVGVRVSAERRGPYALNIGELALHGGEPSPWPQTPMAFTVDAAHVLGDTAEVFLSWLFQDEGVWYYDLYRELPDGRREAVGRIRDEVYYLKSLVRAGEEDASTLQLVAVAPDGSRSAPATANVRWT